MCWVSFLNPAYITISGKDLAKLLEKNGWVLPRTQGTHHTYVKEGIFVPIHSNKPLQVGLESHLMKWLELMQVSYA